MNYSDIPVPPIPRPKVSPSEFVDGIRIPQIQPQDFYGGETTVQVPEIFVPGSDGIKVTRVMVNSSTAVSGNAITNSEAITAIRAAFEGTSPDTIPQDGDFITLIKNGTSELVGRFILKNQNDSASDTLTVPFSGIRGQSITMYAINILSTSVGDISSAITSYLGTSGSGGPGSNPNDIDIEPQSGEPFAITVDGNGGYSADGQNVLTANNTVSVGVNAGTVQIDSDITAVTATAFTPANLSFGSDGSAKIFAFYLKIVITMSGTPSSPSAASATIVRQEVSTEVGLTAVSETTFNAAGTEATQHRLIGTVALLRKGNRRATRINQVLTGNQKTFSDSTNNGSTSSGINTNAGLKEFIVCVNGIAFKTSMITGPLILV
jgi:hypothetical protein